MAFDAFISFKNTAPDGGHTADYEIAKKLHTMLLDEGMNVFFRENDRITADFSSEIYNALDEARLLILVGSSVEHINSNLVKSEYQSFLGAIHSGKKPGGQVITVLSGISVRELPIQLSNLQSFSAGDLDAVVSFAFEALGMVRNSEVRERLAAEEACKRSEGAASAAPAGGKRPVMTVAAVVSLLALLVVVVGAAVSSYYDQPEEVTPYFTFKRVYGGYELVDYHDGLGDEPVLPSTHNGRPVVSIGEEAFCNCDSLTSISIPSSVKSIGYEAFARCDSLTSVTLQDGVRTIGDSAFYGCTGLTSVTIADSVTSIGNRAFWDCTGLASVTIPDRVKSIGFYAFRECSSLTSVTIPDSVTSIDYGAFSYCTNLTSITIPDNVTSIGGHAFWGCTSLTSITIPNNVTSIGDYAFVDCDITITAPHEASYYDYKPSLGVTWVVKE